MKPVAGTVSPISPWGESESLNSRTRLIGTEFVTGPIWEVKSRMTEYLFSLQALQSLNTLERTGIGRPNPRSVDILEHIARALPPSLNPVKFQFCKSQILEEEDSSGAGVGTSFQLTPHLTLAVQ